MATNDPRFAQAQHRGPGVVGAPGQTSHPTRGRRLNWSLRAATPRVCSMQAAVKLRVAIQRGCAAAGAHDARNVLTLRSGAEHTGRSQREIDRCSGEVSSVWVPFTDRHHSVRAAGYRLAVKSPEWHRGKLD